MADETDVNETSEESPIVIPDMVTKEEYEKLGKLERRLLKYDNESEVYVPNLGNAERREALLLAKQKEAAENKRLREENKIIQNKLNMFESNKNVQIKKIEEEKKTAFDKYQERLDALEKARNDDLAKAKSRMEKLSIQKGVSDLSELFLDGHKKLGKAFIESRMSIEYIDDEPVPVFTDDFGNKLTKLSEIKKNLFADEELKDKLRGTDSGGSQFGSHSRSQVVPVVSDIKKAKDEDLVALANANPEAFLALIKSQENHPN